MKLVDLRDKINQLLSKHPDLEVMLGTENGICDVDAICDIFLGHNCPTHGQSRVDAPGVAIICNDEGATKIRNLNPENSTRMAQEIIAAVLENPSKPGKWKDIEHKRFEVKTPPPQPTHPYAWARAGALGPQ